MATHLRPTPAFTLLAPPLACVAIVLAFVVWVLIPTVTATSSSTVTAVAEPSSSSAFVKAAQQKAAPAAPEPRRVVAPGRGVVGTVRLGMTLGIAKQRLGEELVPVSRTTARTARFEYIAPTRGVVVKGKQGKITSITITNAGTTAMAWRTPANIGVGSALILVQRQYPGVQTICGEEHWIRQGANTIRFGGRQRVTSVTLTSDPPPLFVPCA